MQKMQIKQKIKNIGKVLLGVLIVIMIIALMNQYSKTNYDRCIKNGQDEAVCKELLN